MPLADPNGIFGRIVTRRDVQQAAIGSLTTWVPTYIGQLEQQAQLVPGTVPVPPDPVRSYRGGLDFDTWMPAWSPVFIVVVQPIGRPELAQGGGSYLQEFDLQVGVNYQYDGVPPALGEYEEDSAIQYADILGMAGCAAIAQHGSLGSFPDGTYVSTRTRLTQFPMTTFPYPTEESARRVCRSRFSFSVIVSNIVTETDGPRSPLVNPYANAGDWPQVTDASVTITSTGVDGQHLSQSSGANIVFGVGGTGYPGGAVFPGQIYPGQTEEGSATVKY